MSEPATLRLLYVYYEPSPSGQTEHVLTLVQRLDRQRFDVTVVLPDLLEAQASRFSATGAQVIILPIRKLFWKPNALTGFWRLIRKGKYDIIHVHSQEAGVVARPLAWLAGAKGIFYTPHTINIRRRGWSSIYRMGERMMARLTDRIISVNEADRQSMIARGIPSQKIVTIYNGIDLARFSDPQIVEKPGTPLVMQVGRLSEQKAPLDFIEGARLVLQKHPEVRFKLVGDGPLLGQVQTRIKQYGFQEQVTAVGEQANAFRLIQHADIVTLTSSWEGSPYSLLEAMAWSKPVVATSVNGCPELVLDGKTGYLVPSGQPQAWADRVLDLLNNPQAARAMGEQGRRHLEANFTLPEMVAKISALYEQFVL